MKRVIGLLILGAVLSPASLVAQEDPGWRLVPRVGSYWLDRYDAVAFSHRSVGIRQGAVIGVTVDFDTPVSWLGFRLSGDRTLGADLIDRPGVGSTGATTRGLSIETRLQPVPRSWAARPYAVFGGGVLLQEFEDVDGLGSDSQTHGALLYGFGLDVDLAGLPIRLEGFHRRYSSDPSIREFGGVERLAPRTNAHAVFTVGVRIHAR